MATIETLIQAQIDNLNSDGLDNFDLRKRVRHFERSYWNVEEFDDAKSVREQLHQIIDDAHQNVDSLICGIGEVFPT